MAELSRLFNKVIPFADASRPIWQDAIYSLLICTFLYFAPQFNFTHIRRTINDQIQRSKYGRRLLQTNEAVRQDTHDHLPPNEDGQDRHALQHTRPPPAPTVEDNSDSDSDADSLNNDEIAAMIRDAERQGAFADPFAPGPARAAVAAADGTGPHVVEQLLPPNTAQQQQQPRRLRDPNRQVGAKKAKSLARRERVRAYHEFMREQGDMQRAQEASTAQQREAELAEARARRAKVEAEIEEKARRRREEKRAAEEQREKQERQAVSNALELVVDGLAREGRVEVRGVAVAVGRDAGWVADLMRKEGMLDVKQTEKGKFIIMLTSKGWIVRVSEDDMRQLQDQASTFQGNISGKVSWSEMATLLDNILRKRQRVDR